MRAGRDRVKKAAELRLGPILKVVDIGTSDGSTQRRILVPASLRIATIQIDARFTVSMSKPGVLIGRRTMGSRFRVDPKKRYLTPRLRRSNSAAPSLSPAPEAALTEKDVDATQGQRRMASMSPHLIRIAAASGMRRHAGASVAEARGLLRAVLVDRIVLQPVPGPLICLV